MTAGNIHPIKLVLLNGLVPFLWFIMCQSTTGAVLTTGTQLTNFKWCNLHNTSLQNRVLTRDAIARYEYGTREFDSVFFQQVYTYPTCWVPRPMELIKHPANVGFQYFENSFLNITAAVTATKQQQHSCLMGHSTTMANCQLIRKPYRAKKEESKELYWSSTLSCRAST